MKSSSVYTDKISQSNKIEGNATLDFIIVVEKRKKSERVSW